MTGLELRDRLLERAGENPAQPGFYTAQQALDALNAAQRLFVLLTLCLETTGTLPLAANTSFYHLLPTFADFLLPLRVRVAGAGGAKLEPCRLEDMAALDVSWPAAAGTPSKYALLGFDLLAIYKRPGATGTSLSVTYARCPVTLTAGSSPEIPEEDHEALILAGVPILRMAEGGQEFTKTLPLFREFLRIADKRANYVRTRSLAQRYDRVPSEIARYDVSRLLDLAMKREKPAMLSIPQAQERNG